MDSQVTYNTEKVSTKRVRYEGSDQLRAGYALCYNWDSNSRDFTTDGTAATSNVERRTRVEKPAVGNVSRFAGIVTEKYDGRTGPCMVEVYVPQSRGQAVPLWTTANCTIGTTQLFLTPGSYALTTNGVRLVGEAAQTVDRSTTNGTVLAIFKAPLIQLASSARSRTTVQLPTAAIWDNFPLAEMKLNPFLGSLLDADFTRAGDLPDTRFVDATYAASAAGKTPTEHMYLGTTAIGEMLLFSTTDNQAAEGQWAAPIVVSGGTVWGFEARIKQSVVTDTKAGWFVGLMLGQKLAGDLIVDGGTLQTEGSLGFQAKEGDGDKVDFVYDETGQAQNEHDDDYLTQAGGTYFTVGMYFNGTTIQGYLNGVATGTAIVAADISAADFPTAKIFVPTVALKAAHADDYTLTLDWIRAAQLAV